MKSVLIFVASLAMTQAAVATTFVVPSDSEMIRRSDAIVVGSARGSHTRLNGHGGIETVTEFSVSEVIKGVVLSGVIDVVEPGGEYDGRVTYIPGVPTFEDGKQMMLMLKHTGTSRWSVTDLVLGKFSFEKDRVGRALLVRDEDEIVGWDPDLSTHREVRRSAERFLDFVRTESHMGVGRTDYTVSTAPLFQSETASMTPRTDIAPYTANSYTSLLSNGYGSRWTVFPNAVNFYRGVNGEPGAPSNGDTAISMAMAAWDNDPASNVNYVYAGVDNGTHVAGLSGADGANTILFERNLSSFGVTTFTCSGNSYGGTLGMGGITSSGGTHTLGSETFNTTKEVDVEMNVGLANCSLLFSNGDFNSGVTHEVGHTLGFRHSDQDRQNSGACTSVPSLECSSNAIMTATVVHGVNAVLQLWDQHAVQAVYPGSGTPPPPPPTTFVRGDFNGDGKVDLVWRNYATGQVNVWFVNSTQYLGSATLGTVADPNWHVVGVGDFNGDKKSDLVWRNYATGATSIWLMNGTTYLSNVTMQTVDPSWHIEAVNDFNNDGADDLVWRNYSTGADTIWFMHGTQVAQTTSFTAVSDVNWHIVGSGDFNKDGRSDLVWRNYSTGAVNVWFMNGTTLLGAPSLYTVSDQNWKIEAVADYNNDGSSDLVWRNYSTGAVNIWFLNGTTLISGATAWTLSDFNWHIEGPK